MPQEPQKCDSAELGAPHWMQKFLDNEEVLATAGVEEETCTAGPDAVVAALFLWVSSLNPSAASFVPCLNSLIVFPRLRPISGNFEAPKTRNATTMMITM